MIRIISLPAQVILISRYGLTRIILGTTLTWHRIQGVFIDSPTCWRTSAYNCVVVGPQVSIIYLMRTVVYRAER